MRENITEIDRWLSEGKAFCTATVVKTWGSAPRPVGAMLLIGPEGEMLGSVSGGCVEGAILREARGISPETPAKYLKYGVSDDDAWAVGLSCGGTIEVFLERFAALDNPAIWQVLRDCLTHNKGCILLSRISGPGSAHLLVLPDGQTAGPLPPGTLVEHALRAYRERKSQVVEHGAERWFAQVFPHKLRLIITGATHATAELVQLAQYFDFETIVIDPRSAFVQNTHFHAPPDRLLEAYPAEVLAEYEPDEYTFAVAMAHDPKIDDQLLHLLLPTRAAYIGALSGKRSQEQRRERLRNAGFSDEAIQRIHAPVGLPIKSKDAREIALSIVAQMIAVKNQYS